MDREAYAKGKGKGKGKEAYAKGKGKGKGKHDVWVEDPNHREARIWAEQRVAAGLPPVRVITIYLDDSSEDDLQ